MTVRVLIVDDHPMIRSAVTMLLAGSDFSIMASASDARSAVEAVEETDPDLVILDIAMPGGSGLDVLRRMRADQDSRPVVILTAAIDDFALAEALSLPVDGIVMKNSDPAHLLECLEAVRSGRRWIDPDLSERVEEIGRKGAEPALSHRERRLVGLVAQGMRNRDIAAQLGITEGTVKVYLHAIFDKLGVANRTELAIRAAQEGIGP